ncbi:MAG: Peptidase M23 [Microgenomates group bacterium GW2011_GWA1_46_7]|nr:MAG: Peptidase M23 [Microgenomates group bacterium GW2011_GWA1_46_7]
MIKIEWHKLTIWGRQIPRRIFGVQLAGMAITLSLLPYPTHAFNYMETASLPEAEQVVVTTTSQYQFPLAETIGTSQGYHLLHPGVDYRAPKGTEILATEAGTVVEVAKTRVGYGNFVRVAHAGTASSLYAHLDEVKVAAGQKVTKGETLGTVGMTGWTTGPHLHFELQMGNRTVNPAGFISR